MNMDTNGITVQTYQRSHPLYQKYTDLACEFYLVLQNDQLMHNYVPANLHINEWLAISVYLSSENKMLGFSSIAYRDIFASGVRLLNRFVKHPRYRFVNIKMKLSSETNDMIDQQLSVVKNLSFQYAFISRDSSQNAFKYYFRNMKTLGWIHENTKYKVCHGPVACCQMISWIPLKANAEIDMEPCNA